MTLVKSNMRLFHVGRLDCETEGLLILTNDGDLANKLMHPKHRVLKEYYAEVEGRLTSEHLAALRNGVTLDDGFVTSKAKVRLIASGKISRVYLTIGEGKNRQVRRMFEALGFPVLYLSRTQIGSIKLERDFLPGSYRNLTQEEITYLNELL